jgi:hypothetical protein
MKDNIKMLIPVYGMLAMLRWVSDVVDPDSWEARVKAMAATIIFTSHILLLAFLIKIITNN